MANTLLGAPTVAQVQLLTDQQASIFKTAWPLLGMNAPGESGTIEAAINSAIIKILGDGGSNPGLGNPDWEAQIKDALAAERGAFRADVAFARALRTQPGLLASLDSRVRSNLPSGWAFTNGTVLHPFDAWLTRINGAYGASAAANGTALAPGSAGTVAAVNNANGALPVVSAGSAPRIVHTLVGSADWQESLPSAQATQTAIALPNNAYTYTLSGTVPAGVTKLRIYRGYVGGGAGIYYWDQDVAVVAGNAWSGYVATIKNPDSLLRIDWTPPVWASCFIVPEAAALWALSLATARQGGLDNLPLAFKDENMLSPWNVILGRSDAFMGIGNVAQASQYSETTLTGAATFTTVAGTIQGTNNPAGNVQGFAGGIGIQARVTTALAAAGTVTISYTFFDSVHGWGSVQTTSGVTATFGGTTVGSLATWTIPNDANGKPLIIQSVTVTAVSGFSSGTGKFILESPAARAY